MSQKLTEAQLRKMIRQEYKMISISRKPLITEARANQLATEILNEGIIFNAVKGFFAKIKGGATTAGKILGDEALKALQPVGAALAKAKQNAVASTADFGEFVAKIKDEAAKAAIEAQKESMKNSVTNIVKKELAGGISELTSSGFTPEEAKGMMSNILAAVLSEITS